MIKAISSRAPDQRILLYEKIFDNSSLGRYQIRNFLSTQTVNFYQNQQNFSKTPKETIKKELDIFIREIESSIEKSPLDYKSHLQLGTLYSFYIRLDQNKIVDAERELNKAIKMSPQNQQGYWALAQVKLYQKDYDEAFILAEKALQLDPRVGQSHLILIQIAKIEGNDKLAEKKANEALKIIPSLKPQIEKILNYNYGKQQGNKEQ